MASTITAKRLETGGRLFAIGDIHGCADEVAAMLKTLAPVRGDTVVFVGDYVDRGPNSRAVIDLLLEVERGPAEFIFLKGNHEDMMLAFMGFHGNYGESFLMNGGEQTLASYGVREPTPEGVKEKLPETHLEFLRRLETSHIRPPYLFVHAGIMPTRTLEEQTDEDLLWIRHEFIFSPHPLNATVIFGHTPMRAVMVDLPYKLGIDTGLVYGGKLTCLELTEGIAYQVARGSGKVTAQSIQVR